MFLLLVLLLLMFLLLMLLLLLKLGMFSERELSVLVTVDTWFFLLLYSTFIDEKYEIR